MEERLGKAVLNSLEKEEREIAKLNESRAQAPGFVDVLWDRIDSIRHILVGVKLWSFFLLIFF